MRATLKSALGDIFDTSLKMCYYVVCVQAILWIRRKTLQPSSSSARRNVLPNQSVWGIHCHNRSR